MPPSTSFTVGLLVAASVACTSPRQASVWSFRTDRPWLAGDSNAFTPVVDREPVFFCGGYFWNDDDAIHALALKDGRLAWKHHISNCGSAPWLIAGTLVVHSQEPKDGPCVFQGFDPAAGTVRWRREFRTGVPSQMADCRVQAAVAGESLVFAFVVDQAVHALHAADGTDEPFTFPVERRRDQRIWLTASGSDAWFGFGTHRWRWPAGHSQPDGDVELSRDVASPERAAASGTKLFLGGDRPVWLRAFDLTTGQLLWEQAAFSSILSLSAGERLYVNIFRRQWELIALDMDTGHELWTAGAGGFHSPMQKDGWLYANGGSSVFVAEPMTGRIASTIEAEAEVITTPIRAGDLLLFGTINGALHAVDVGRLERAGGGKPLAAP